MKSLILVAVVLAAMPACSSPPTAATRPTTSATAPATGGSVAATPATAGSAASTHAAGSSTYPYGDPTTSPTPAPIGSRTASSIPLSIHLTPACVRPGGIMHLDIETSPKAGVAYQAWYSDGKSGAGSGYGAGYGGNAGGKADSTGHYQDSWAVSIKAPVGQGRLDVYAFGAPPKGGNAQGAVRFAVADAAGHC